MKLALRNIMRPTPRLLPGGRSPHHPDPLLESLEIMLLEPTMGGERTETGGEKATPRERDAPIQAPLAKRPEVAEQLWVADRDAQAPRPGLDRGATSVR